jgi:hypothetical protein
MAFALGTTAGAGTISIVAGGTIVTGVGTNFQAANVGAILVVGAQWGVIASIASTTSVTLDRPFATAVTGSAYTISANIPVITQTGTDTSLSTLTGVAGVTVSTNLWTITSATLVINGSLTINRLTNRLRFLNPANLVTAAVTPPTLTVGATGTFNNSVVQSSGGYTYRSPNYSIMFDGVIPTLTATTGSLIGTVLGSTSVFEGNIEFANLLSGSVLTFNFEGTTTLQYGALLNSSAAGNNILFYVANGSSNLTINNYTSVGVTLRVANNTLNINNYAATAGVQAININTPSAINNPQYVGLQDLGNTSGVRTAATSLKYFQLVNFSSTALTPSASLASTTGSQVLFVNQLSLSASGSAGAIQDVKFWARDSNNGSRSPTNYGAGLGYEIATTGNLTYTATTAASGIAPTLNIISVIYWQDTASTFVRDYRGNDSATSQNLNIYSFAYNYVPSNSLTNLYPLVNGVYGGASVRNQGFVLLTDQSITQTTMATVAAYTVLDTAQQLYDYAKYYLYTNFAGQTATYVTRSGNTIDAGSYNVIIDATATTPFVFAGSTITVDSTNFTGSLTTSGAVTLANGALISNNTVTANVSQATPTDLTGVTINGNLTYNTNSPITITLTNCAISGTVSNSGSGLVTISLTNSTIGTVGSNVTSRITTSLTINGLTAGSQIYIANGSGTQVAYVASSGTSYTLATTGQTGTWTWKVARYGFTAQTGTHSPAVASTTVTVTLSIDVFVTQTTKATVAAYEFLPNMDTLYDYAAYYETLEIGIPYSRIITKAGTNASAGSYPVEINETGIVWTFDGSSLSIWCGDRLSPGVTITGALFSIGDVTILPSNFGNTAITANVIQPIPFDLSSMTITGNLSYNDSAPYAYTVTITDSTITGVISNIGTAEVKVIKAGTSPFFTAGARVRVVAVVAITTPNNLALSTYILKNAGIDLGWVVQDTARSLEIQAGDTFSVYAVAYGYQRTLFYPTASNFNSFSVSLLPETNVDTSLNTTIRDYIATQISTALVGPALAVSVASDLRAYSPADVLNGLQYYSVVYGELPAYISVITGTTAGFSIISGGVYISSPAFFAQVNNAVTTTTNLGILIPLYFDVDPAVYITDPTYTPTRKNTSGIVLQTAPWTQQTATISATDKEDIRAGLALEATVDLIPTNVLNETVEPGATLVESLRLANAVLGGRVSGGGTGTETFRNLANTKNRLISSNDAQGNRTSEVTDLT